jgi:shikimate kinase/3-dehydroquinate synthase
LPVFLVGFMGAGKSAAGRALAARLGVGFVDLDEIVEAEAGESVAAIFSAEGEEGFRRRETAALAQVTGGGAGVVATGGGTPTWGDNLVRMRRAGLVVELTAPLEILLARAAADGGAERRPLLSRGPAAAAALLAARQPIYRRAAHATVATAGRDPAEIARRIAGLVPIAAALGAALPDSSICALERAAYPIAVGAGLLESLGERVAGLPGVTRVAVISDGNLVAAGHATAARRSLENAGLEVVEWIVAAGEASKSVEVYGELAEDLVAAGLDRKSVVVALGGGVVGDLAGFVAATLFRGVRLVQVATSLVAMVDSAIGGKTGVNLEAGKNLLGAFWQPELVLVDPNLLATLPARERRAGIGELLKYGLLDGRDLYRLIERDPTGAEAIGRAAGYKSWIVTRDEREESGERALLNLGHTVGHAIERAAGYGEVLHGEAVGLGLLAAARVSAALGLAAAELEAEIAASLAAAGLDTDIERWLRPEVLAHIGVDKKRTGEIVGFVAVAAVGEPGITPVSVAELAKILLPRSRL